MARGRSSSARDTPYVDRQPASMCAQGRWIRAEQPSAHIQWVGHDPAGVSRSCVLAQAGKPKPIRP